MITLFCFECEKETPHSERTPPYVQCFGCATKTKSIDLLLKYASYLYSKLRATEDHHEDESTQS